MFSAGTPGLCRTAIFVALAVVVSGCATERIISSDENLSAPTVMQEDALNNLTVSIEPPVEENTISSIFVRGIKGAKVFKAVESLAGPGGSVDIVLSDYKHITDSPGTGFQCWEPMLAILTLGIVPVVCEETHNISFSVRNSQGRTIQISGEFKRKKIIGWIALPVKLSSKWSSINSNAELQLGSGYERYMRDVLLSRADEIIAIAGPPN